MTEEINANITDAEMDKFFESGGEDINIETQEENNSQSETPQDESQTQDAPQDKAENATLEKASVEEERSYKAAMHEERERRKELQRELLENKQRLEKVEETFQRLVEQAKQAQMPKEPSFDEDPLEALRIKQERLEQFQREQQVAEQQRAQYEQMSQKQQQFLNQYQRDSIAFASKASDFKDAYQYLIDSKVEEFKSAGYSDDEAGRLLYEDEFAIAAKAYNDGVNPAERIYNLAKVRGYQAKSATTNNVNDEGLRKFQDLERGIKASNSLGSGSGGRIDKGLTLEALAEMDDAEFASNWHKIVRD